MKKTLSLRSTKRYENELNLIRLKDRDTKVKFMLKILEKFIHDQKKNLFGSTTLVYGGPLVS